jgi:futalosine hydrolase
MQPFLIIGAVVDEIFPLMDFFKSPSEMTIGGRKAIFGKLAGRNVVALVTGIGLVNVAQSLTAAIETLNPAMVIQTGCGGAYKTSGLSIGDLGIADEEIDFHLGLERHLSLPAVGKNVSNSFEFPESLPFPVMIKDGCEYQNRFPLDKGLSRWAFEILNRLFENSVQIATGSFVTVSTITATEEKASLICQYYTPCIESMEGSGAAQICLFYNIAFLEIRGVSNDVGNRNRSQWNLPLASETSVKAAHLLIKFFHQYKGL